MQSIYERLVERGLSEYTSSKFMVAPADASDPVWGVVYSNSWPDLGRGGNMTWEQAYHAVLDERDARHEHIICKDSAGDRKLSGRARTRGGGGECRN